MHVPRQRLIARCRREHQPLQGIERTGPGVVGGQILMATQPAPVSAGVQGERPVEVAPAGCGGGDRLCQPLRGLQGPPASHSPQGIAGQGGVADERDARCGRLAAVQRVVDGAGDLRDAFGGVDGRCFGQGSDEFEEAALQVFPEGRQPLLVREHRHDRHPVVVRKRVGHVGLEKPGVTDPAVQRKVAEVREIAEPRVLVQPRRHLGELRYGRVLAICADHQAGRDLALTLWCRGAHPHGTPGFPDQPGHLMSEQQIDARGLRRMGPDQRVEGAAPNVVRVRQLGALRCGPRLDPSPTGVPAGLVADGSRPLESGDEAEFVQHRVGVGREGVGAQRLVRFGVRAAFQQCDADTGTSEQDRRGAAGEAGSADDDVVVVFRALRLGHALIAPSGCGAVRGSGAVRYCCQEHDPSVKRCGSGDV